MLEIEQQFPFSPDQLPAVQKLFSPATTRTLEETYFDSPAFSLLKNDTWLRKRNGAYELKYRKPENRGQQLEVYEEFTDEDSIKEFLAVPQSQKLSTWIETNLQPIITITTTRHTFKDNLFTIDIDLTDFNYSVCEIEYVSDKSPPEAQAEILKLAQKLGLEARPVKNKAKAFVEKQYPTLTIELKGLGIL